MTAEIRLVALDLDGTLLTSAGTLPAQGAALLTQAAGKGVHVILATTRIYESTLRFYQAMALSSPLVCGNGAQVWATAGGPLWAEHCISEECARIIARLADEQGWELGITVGSMHYWRQRPDQPLGLHAPNITIVAANRDAIVGSPLRILAWDTQAITEIGGLCRSELAGQCGVELYVNPDGTYHSLGVFAPMANKGVALNLVMQRLNVTREQVVTIGDNFNDLPMFACSDTSVAMRNAPSAVKQQASLVAPSNDDEGVAWALRALGIV
jgi:Cof subfamily protein (haloacid dehalogenase superfamily)